MNRKLCIYLRNCFLRMCLHVLHASASALFTGIYCDKKQVLHASYVLHALHRLVSI